MRSAIPMALGSINVHVDAYAQQAPTRADGSQPDADWHCDGLGHPSLDFTTFMTVEASCISGGQSEPAEAKGSSVQRLHVRRSGNLLIITEADDLHTASSFLVARHLSDVAGYSVYQLLSQLPGGASQQRFRAGTGAVSIRRKARRRCLKLVGQLDTNGRPIEAFIEAIEMRE